MEPQYEQWEYRIIDDERILCRVKRVFVHPDSDHALAAQAKEILENTTLGDSLVIQEDVIRYVVDQVD